MMPELKIEKPRKIQHQIAEHIRNAIWSGALEQGAKLPSTKELSVQWDTHAATVHGALSILVREGLLTRRPRVGTIVRKRSEKLARIGLYYSKGVWTTGAMSGFQRTLYGALQQSMERAKISSTVWIDPRPENQQDTPWADLVDAAASHKIQGLIVTATDMWHAEWQNKLPIPSSHFIEGKLSNGVRFNVPDFTQDGVRVLAKQGCKSVGMIAIVPTTTPDRNAVYEMFHTRFYRTAESLGLEVRDEWVLKPEPEGKFRSTFHEQWGYEQFHKLWDRAEHPDGLLVYTDVVASGVMLALAERQVRVPEELKLVLHKNADVPYVCPVPATFLVSDPKEAADALLKQVQMQFDGQPVSTVAIKYSKEVSKGLRRRH